MALLPGIGFVSASHDCTLRVWDEAGALLAELVCLQRALLDFCDPMQCQEHNLQHAK